MKRLLALALVTLTALGAVYEWGGPARRGVRALKEGRFDEALRALESGRADLPGAAVIPYNEGLAHLGKGEADSAVVRFREATGLKGDPAREAAAYNLGNLSMRAKEYGRAARYYKEALKLKPDDIDAKRNLEEALRRMREEGGQRRQPPSGGQGPPTPGGAQQAMPRQSPGAAERPPSPPSPRPGEFTKEEAERWLQALESERRSRRQEGKARPGEETGNRDW